MYSLNEITLSGYGTYNDATFPFLPGLTRVSGNNRSGKSLIFTPLSAVMYSTDGIVPKGGKAVLNGLDDKTPFDATVFNQGKSDRYSLSIDGVDQQTDTIAKSKEALSKFFRVSKSIFDTTVSISSKIPHPLSLGTGSSRLDWAHETLAFSEVYDNYAKLVERDIKELRENATKHKLLKDELNDLDKDAPKKPKRSDIPDTAEMAAKIEQLQAELDRLRQQEKLPKRPKFTVEEYTAKVRAGKEKLTEMRAKHDKYQVYRAKLKLFEARREKNEKALQRIATLRDALNVPEKLNNTKLQSAAKKQLMKAKEVLKALKAINDQAEEQETLRKWRDKKTVLVDSLRYARDIDYNPNSEADLSATIRKLTKLMHYYESSAEDMTGECKICGKDLEKSGNDFLQRAQQIKNTINGIEYNYAVKSARKIKWVEAKDTAKIEAKISRLEELLPLLEFENNQDAKPSKVEFDAEEYEALQDKQRDLVEALRKAKAYEAAIDDTTEILEPEVLAAKIAKLDKRVRALNREMIELNDQRIEQATAVSLWKRYLQQRKALTEKIDELKEFPRKLKVALALRQAFGRDGLRVDRLSETLELFVANLNACAPLLFNEPFKFEIEVGARKCDVIAHRNNKRGSITTVSSSESRMWQAVAALAMLRILPNAHRFDTIILDEIEANMDDASIERYVNSFLPELQKVVPKVIVVTPLSHKRMYIPADHDFRVTKKNGVSSIRQLT